MLRGCANPGREMAEPGVLCGKDKTKMGLLKELVVGPNRALSTGRWGWVGVQSLPPAGISGIRWVRAGAAAWKGGN